MPFTLRCGTAPSATVLDEEPTTMSAPPRHVRNTSATRWAALLAGLGLVATACGGGADPAAVATGTPAAVQELVVGVGADPWVDAEGDRKRRPNYPLNSDVCQTLVHLGTGYQLEPMLAQKWEITGENTFRFTLADGATFSDGTPVDATAVKYSIDYTVQEPSIGFSFLGADSTVVVDERTVEITPESPNQRLVEQINHPTYAVLTPGDDPLNDPNVTCTGPFQVASYTPEQELVVARNENYWGEPAKLSRITFRFYPDDTTRVLAMQNAEVDLITDVPQGILASIEGQPGVEVARSPVGNVTMMYVARRDAAGTPKLLADPALRRAVAASIDTEAFVNGVLGGNAEVVDQVSPPAVLGEFADMVKGVDFDPAAAGRLLDEAGWTRQGDGIRTRDGRPLTLSIIYQRVPLTVAEFVQSQLRAVGIDGRIQQLDPGAYSEATRSGNYDLDISQPSQNDANPAFLLALRWYPKATGANATIISPGPGTVYDGLIEQTLTATDPQQLRRVAAQAMHELVDVEVGGIPLSGNYRIFAVRDNVEGVELHPSGTNQRWSTAYLTE